MEEEELDAYMKKINLKVNVMFVTIISFLLVLLFAAAVLTAKVDGLFTFVVKAIPLLGAM